MAAPCTRLAISALLKGLHLAQGRSLWMQTCQKTAVPLCLRLMAAGCRPIHLSSGPAPSSTKVHPKQSTEPQKTTDTQKDGKKAKEEEEEEEEYEGPEYIPKRKAKNPMMPIGYAWMIGLPTGIIGFILCKREVDKNRLKQLRIRQRMKKSNEGEYDRSRYRHTEEAGLDR